MPSEQKGLLAKQGLENCINSHLGGEQLKLVYESLWEILELRKTTQYNFGVTQCMSW